MKKMHLKKRKIFNKKKLLSIFLFMFIFYITYTLSIEFLLNNKYQDKKYVKHLLKTNYDKKMNYKFLLSESMKFISRVDIDKPSTFLDSKIKNTKEKEIKEEYSKEDNYNNEDYNKLTTIIKDDKKVDNPILYIYNTHQLETYTNVGLENSNVLPNVMMASYLLKEKMDKKKIYTKVEDTNMEEFIRISNITENKFYGSSRIFLKNAISKYPSLKYFIDIHRDSISKEISTININNKDYARVLFVIGTNNETYKENEKVSKIISDKINEKYPKLSRGIFERSTTNWPEAYNQDISKYSILIEVGGKDNNFMEVSNTIDVLSEILESFIKEEENEHK